LTNSIIPLIEDDPSVYIQIGEMIGDTGQTWLEVLYNSIVDKKSLLLHYQSYGSTIKIRTVSPYVLKEYRNQWYLVAYCKEIGENGSTNTFKLNRIKKIEPAGDPYYYDSSFSKEDYFKYTLGVFHKKDIEPTVVKLKFKKFLVQLIVENKIHPTMEVLSHKEDELIVTIKVYNTIELKNLILSYGSNVTVIEPQELRNEIVIAANLIKENYC
jgi:predicted DNA-binding transcriptional regulator YafY